MEFANIYILIISLVPLALAGVYYLWKKRTRRLAALRIPMMADLLLAEKKASYFNLRKGLLWGERLFFLLTVSFILIALARPQNITEEQHIIKNGVDILIALDVSESMLAEDLQPNRIEAAKTYINEFVTKLVSDRVGLVVFAGKPFTQSPMSFDYNVIRYYLSEVSTQTIDQRRRGLGGTAIGDAILAGINRFKNNEDRTKVMILLTDGEANVGVDPLFAAEHARSNGLKIYTIGLGKKEGAPVTTIQNGKKVYARNSDGTVFISKFDEETLINIAEVSGGKYFYAGNNGALRKSFDTINALEKTEHEAEISITREDKFWMWLFLGFLSSVGATFLRFLQPYFEERKLKHKVKK